MFLTCVLQETRRRSLSLDFPQKKNRQVNMTTLALNTYPFKILSFNSYFNQPSLFSQNILFCQTVINRWTS